MGIGPGQSLCSREDSCGEEKGLQVQLPPRPVFQAVVWLVSSAASPKVHIYSCFYAMLATQSTVISHGMHKQVEPNHGANQTCKTNHVHAPGTSLAPRPASSSGRDSRRAGWEEQEAGVGAECPDHTHTQGVPSAPTQGRSRVRGNGTFWAWLGSQHLSSLRKVTPGPTGVGEGALLKHIC